MHRYDILFAAHAGEPSEAIRMEAASAGFLFGWAQRHSAGRRFEVFEDGASLGGATLDAESGVWTIFPPATAQAATAA